MYNLFLLSIFFIQNNKKNEHGIISHFELFYHFVKKSFWQEIQKIFRALKIPEFNSKCFADAKYNFFLI